MRLGILLLALLAFPVHAQQIVGGGIIAYAAPSVPDSITATNPGTLTASAAYTQAGTYAGTGYTPLALDYSFDSTACGSAATSPTIGSGNYSFANTAPSGTGSHTITVCDHSSHSIFGTSTSFTVNSAAAYPLDAQSGASACYLLGPCSSAIAGAGTQVSVSITRTSDNHVCDIKVGSSPGTLATTVSGCSTSGDNGTAVTSWCAATTCNASTNSSAPGQALRDQTGNGNDQNVTGAIAFTASCFSTNYCYTAPGATGNVIGNGNLSGATMIGSVFTMVAWVKPTQLNSGTAYDIQGSFGVTNRPEFRIDGQAGNATGKLVLNVAGTTNIGTSTCTISINAWHSIAVTYDVSGNYAFYADGAPCGSGTNLQIFTWSTDFPLFLQQGFGGTASEPFFGSIRGIVIYKSALAAATVEAVMNTGP